jgi:hypothetical protein
MVSKLQTNSSQNTHSFFLRLLRSPVGVAPVRPQQQSANIFGLHFPLNLFSISEMS